MILGGTGTSGANTVVAHFVWSETKKEKSGVFVFDVIEVFEWSKIHDMQYEWLFTVMRNPNAPQE